MGIFISKISVTEFSQNFASGVVPKKEKKWIYVQYNIMYIISWAFYVICLAVFFIWSRRWCKWVFFYHRCFFMNCSVISFFFFIFTFGPILDAVILPALCENNVGLAACTLVSYSITIALSLSYLGKPPSLSNDACFWSYDNLTYKIRLRKYNI